MGSENGGREQRPSPDELLSRAMQETQGKLRIFLGAAPGVGKTYTMLEEAHAMRDGGLDVVVGIVETHGRRETQDLVDGLEIIPSREVVYRDKILREMDIDAILARHPAIVLVDELAHTNVPGSRHLKRYQDVEELLRAGIDVLTTINIQHIESLNDIVARITRIRVRETVPDSIIDRADEIEVVDVTPEQLIKRLNDGKVYVREQAQRALKHYFSPGNLTALRELALRRTAQRVDDQMLSYMRANAISGPWAAGERVMVCISEHPQAPQLVRYARRIADRTRAPWSVVYVETPRHLSLTEEQRNVIADTMRLAEQLGATTVMLPGKVIAEDVLDYARENNITQIVIGKSERPWWFELRHGSVVRDLLKEAGPISVHVMASGNEGQNAAAEGTGRPVNVRPGQASFELGPYVAGAMLVVAATIFGRSLASIAPVSNVALIFSLAVLLSAIMHGLRPSLVTAFLAAAAYNFFFLKPLYTFTVANPSNFLSLVIFFLSAVIVSRVASQSRVPFEMAKRRAKETAELFAFSRKLVGISALDDLLWATAYQMASMLKVRVVLLLPGQGRLAVRAAYPPEDHLDAADFAAAEWSWGHNQAAGRGADTLPGARRLFMPIRTERGPIGVVGLDDDSKGFLLRTDQQRLLHGLIDQVAVAIERVMLAASFDEARLDAETEKLRNALLNSISHDLKTPLSTILGVAQALRSFGSSIEPAERLELLDSLVSEAHRLSRFVQDLLDMTRLESGAVVAKAEPVSVSEVLGQAVEGLKQVLARHALDIYIPPDLPFVLGDHVLLEQVFFNLLDNAAKYSAQGTKISISARSEADSTMEGGGQVVISVMDEGPGIPPKSLDLIFEKFQRIHSEDRQRAGTGLGLAICRGFLEAMGGSIVASNRIGQVGAIFTVTLPIAGDFGRKMDEVARVTSSDAREKQGGMNNV